MEVWALEAYGAAYILQELLTVKSDDVDGRTKIYESMVKGRTSSRRACPSRSTCSANEIKGLGLNITSRSKGSPEALLGSSAPSRPSAGSATAAKPLRALTQSTHSPRPSGGSRHG
jgi:hypothetical protein